MNKTKYILHGGFRTGEKQVNDAFFSEILKTAPDPANILIVYFATENGDKYFPEDQEQFNKNSGGKKLTFVKATKENFIGQTKSADIIYLHGGSSLPLLDILKKFPDFPKLIQGKIVAGDSAGANYLSTVFYSRRNGVGEGDGILPIKIIPHFIEENRHQLDTVHPELKTIFLPEYHFEIYEH